MAAAPMREARMRSWAVGEPPRWRCPRIDTRTSYCGYSFLTRSAKAIAPPVTGLSATSTIEEFLLFRNPLLMSSSNWSTSVDISGMMAASAPAAIAVEREKSGIASHHFDEKQTFVGCRRVAYFVDALHDGVERRVVADCGVGAKQVVVDCARKPDNRNVELCGKDAGTRERTVAADDDKGVDAVLGHVFVGDFAAFCCFKFCTTRGFQDGAALLDDIGYVLRMEFDNFVGYEPAISAVNAFDGNSVEDGGTSDGANSRIHAGGIAAGSQNTDAFSWHSCSLKCDIGCLCKVISNLRIHKFSEDKIWAMRMRRAAKDC